jgi:hypothetical protein
VQRGNNCENAGTASDETNARPFEHTLALMRQTPIVDPSSADHNRRGGIEKAGVPALRPSTWPRASIAHSGVGGGCFAAPENRCRRLDTEAARRQDDVPHLVDDASAGEALCTSSRRTSRGRFGGEPTTGPPRLGWWFGS